MTFYRGNPLRAGVVAIISGVALVLLALAINLSFGLPFNLSVWPPGQDYSLKASFKDANGLSRGADVVIAGHTVGQVTGVSVEGSEAVVSMRIQPGYAPVRRGSLARIRYSTLLAQKYIEVTPAQSGEGLRSGATIASSDTITPVDFDQFISALDPQTRQRLQVVIQQLGTGVQGQQLTINDLLAQLNGLSQESRAPLSTFSAHDQDLSRIVTNLALVSGRLSQSRQQLGDLVGSMGDVTGTLARNDKALASLLAHLGNVMGDFDATLNGNEKNLRQTVQALDPLITQLDSTLALVYGDLHGSLGAINANTSVLNPEVVSAVSEPGADGGGVILRQYLVANPGCDQVNSQSANPQCQTGAAPALPAITVPLANPPAIASCVPKLPTPPVHTSTPRPTPSLSPLPCPTVSPSGVPVPSPCMPLPTPTPKPVPTPSVSVCPSVPGLSLPLGEFPDWLRLLLGGGA